MDVLCGNEREEGRIRRVADHWAANLPPSTQQLLTSQHAHQTRESKLLASCVA